MIECGYTCHAKCQMKAPQDCTGVNLKLEAKKSKKKKKGKEGEEDNESINGNSSLGSLKRTSTSSSITASVQTTNSMATSPTSSRPGAVRRTSTKLSGAPTPERYASPSTANGGGGQKAKVLYGYDATSSQELSVKPNDSMTVVEPDDGSGWILARIGQDEGLVPASYVEMQTSEIAPKKGPPVAPRRGAKKAEEQKRKYFKALYDYDAGSGLELSIRE